MTYNVRYLNQGDGEDHWDHRVDTVAQQIAAADVVGLQEATRVQIDQLALRLPSHHWLGVGRDDGKDRGEFSPIFYRQDRFELKEQGTFWLAEDPTAVGAKAWGANLPRICSWAKLADKRSQQVLLVMNTHFDHQSARARSESAKLLRRQASLLGGDLPVVLMGDLNCTPQSDPVKALLEGEQQDRFTDSRDLSQQPPAGPDGTWNGFKEIQSGQRIDYVLLSQDDFQVLSHETLDPKTPNGRFASDHLPVLVTLEQKSTSADDDVAQLRARDARPNVVVIFIDDLGYADIGPFGAKGYATPHLDRMAREGIRLTNFVVSSAVCSASRAALLTGCYHVRLGLHGALGPNSPIGIAASEVTLGELCQSQGFATACFGKWHLGDAPQFLPQSNGFDHYFGLPYSNDMWPFHPANVARLRSDPNAKPMFPPLPLIEGDQVIDHEVTAEEQAELTKQYTERAVNFIAQNRERPFFLYVPHTMVHVPLYASEAFRGKSGAGLFADVMQEIDWSVGEILGALQDHGIDDKTLVVFTSDNGPWLSYGDHAGSAAPLREGKGTMFEGGYRVPTLARWPGVIPKDSVCDQLASTIDLLPTVAHLIDAPLPQHPIDGKNVMPLLKAEPGAKSPHEAFYCYYGNGELQAVRDSRWKLVFPHQYRTLAGRPGGKEGIPVEYSMAQSDLALYDLQEDIAETTNVIEKYPEIANRLQAHADAARVDLGDRLQGRTGKGVREVGRLSVADGTER
jgi:arylsulfatase A-like enzyme/endonuclease/exonuclease/phosphatase family metal-dependent hydrolase